MNGFTKFGIGFVLVFAVVYQTTLKSLLFVTLGVGRELQPISDFPYQCRRIREERLQACEDMWLSEKTRKLFLACSDPAARSQWMPNIGNLNASGRALNDAVIAMDIDKPKGDGFEHRVLKTPYFHGVAGDGRLHLAGLTGRDVEPSGRPNDPEDEFHIDLYLTNARPTLNKTTGELLDNTVTGADMTIEYFTTDERAVVLEHEQTYLHPQIRTPNNIALSNPKGFFYTNDHGTAKTGWRFQIAPLVRNGDVSFCGFSGICRKVADGIAFPNGLIMGQKDNRLYVPSALAGGITVFDVDPARNIQKADFIDIPYPIDNLSQDKKGDIWAAAVPQLPKLLGAFADPLKIAPTTIFRVRRKGNAWIVDKVLEDRDAEFLPGATTAIHDAKTGRIFLSSVTAPFITVCDPK